MIVKYYYIDQETFERGSYEVELFYINELYRINFEDVFHEIGMDILATFHANKFRKTILVEDYEITEIL